MDEIITSDEVSELNLRLLGYSWGAVTAINVAYDLSQPNRRIEGYLICTKVPVARLITIDPITMLNSASPVKDNVQVFRNYYQRKGGDYRTWLRRSDGIVEVDDGGTILSRRLRGKNIRRIDGGVNAMQVRVDTDRKGVRVSDAGTSEAWYSEIWSYGDFINHDIIPWYVKEEVINDFR